MFKPKPEAAFYVLHRVDDSLRLFREEDGDRFHRESNGVEKARGIDAKLQSTEYVISKSLKGVQSIVMSADALSEVREGRAPEWWENTFEMEMPQLD
ncbi:MAG TPA: hypothetical protein ENG69_02250 [Candidatus Korarchaeota archaeon]|nr:hypothetical protein [Candidatus Korarchaeota archaeon]